MRMMLPAEKTKPGITVPQHEYNKFGSTFPNDKRVGFGKCFEKIILKQPGLSLVVNLSNSMPAK